MLPNIEDMQKAAKEQFEALTATTTNASKSYQEIATSAAEYSKKAFETAKETAEKLAACKSFENAIQIQTDYAKSAYEDFMAQSKKMGELYTAVAKETFKPIQTAMEKTTEGAKTASKAPTSSK